MYAKASVRVICSERCLITQLINCVVEISKSLLLPTTLQIGIATNTTV